MTFSFSELARCAEREVKQREHVYPRLVSEGRMKARSAQVQTDMMREIARRMAELAEAEEASERLL